MDGAMLDLGPLLHWHNIDGQIRAAIIGGCATVLSATIAAFVVFFQIGRQARKARENIRHTEELKLKLQIYERILKVCADAESARREFESYVHTFLLAVHSAKAFKDQGKQWPAPQHRYPRYSSLSGDAQTRLTDVHILVEDWQLVDPRIVVFRSAFGATWDETAQILGRLTDLLIPLLPAEMPENPGKLFSWNVPSEGDIARLSTLYGQLQDSGFTAMTYLMDFRTEMQKLLLGPLFPKNKIAIRKPIDPKFKVIELSKHRELTAYFENETEWGRKKKELERRAREAVKVPPQDS